MRCLACNCRLNDKESTRKYLSSGTFVDLCDPCFTYVEEDVPTADSGDIVDDPFIDDVELDLSNPFDSDADFDSEAPTYE